MSSDQLPLSIDARFQQAASLHQSGQITAAQALYLDILKVCPAHFGSLHLLGVTALQTGQPDVAEPLIREAISLDPSVADAHYNLGRVLHAMQRPDEALVCYERALAINPANAGLYLDRGNVLVAQGRLDEALESYEQAIALSPENPDAFSNRGSVLKMLGKLEEAAASCEHALALNPDHGGALNNRGNALLGLWRVDEALACFQKVTTLYPHDADGFSNYGNALLAARYLEAALLCYDAALSLNHNLASTWNNRGNALVSLQRFEEAATSFERALALKPEIPFLFGTWLHTRMKVCDWRGLADNLVRYMAAIEDGKPVAAPFPTLSLIDKPALHRKVAETHAAIRYPALGCDAPFSRAAHSEKIRIGYYSADFHNHATAYLMAELFEAHDRQRFELYAFSFGPDKDDEMRRRLTDAFDHFIAVGKKSDREVAALSRELGVDIAVDLKGYTQDCRPGIFAAACAPIQVNYLGYPGTMGAPYIHYVIADRTVIPPDRHSDYTEAVVYLPDTYQVNDSTRKISDRLFTREEFGLPADGFVFCCFNNNYKILPASFDSWMRILKSVDGSVLWLLEDNAVAAKNLRQEAVARGVAADRLVFAPRVPLDEHLARHRLADLFLDTLPYNAHTTASDALWAGLPVLTQAGESFASRVAASLLRVVGLPELIVETAAEYETTAIALAGDRQCLDGLKERLGRNRHTSPLFDGRRFAKNLEAAYEAMFARHQNGLPPAFIEV